MKYSLFTLFAVLASSIAEENVKASPCDPNACDINNNCRCSTAASPLDGDLSEWPQLVSLVFADAVTNRIYGDYYEPLLFNRKNPDDQVISATFFVSHEYTDYQRVNDLYNLGFEIGVYSITTNPLQQYWRQASTETLINEFQGQKHIISKFANIPEDKILGVRTPQLQLAGNYSIRAYLESGLSYDNSWSSLPTRRMLPYTLDYLSNEQCTFGGLCPNEAFPGFWILPINDLTGFNNTECNVIASCNIEGTSDEIASWLTDQIESVANSTRVPMTLTFSSSWFNSTDSATPGFNKFLDNMEARGDVYLVSTKQILDFMKNPVKRDQFVTDSTNDPVNCNPTQCRLRKGNEDRNMNCCTGCPDVYPWVGNPDGNNQ